MAISQDKLEFVGLPVLGNSFLVYLLDCTEDMLALDVFGDH